MSEPKFEFLLLFRNNVWHQLLSPEEIQRVMTDWMSWFDELVAELCPGLPCGATVEVRKLMERCGASQQVKDSTEIQS